MIEAQESRSKQMRKRISKYLAELDNRGFIILFLPYCFLNFSQRISEWLLLFYVHSDCENKSVPNFSHRQGETDRLSDWILASGLLLSKL
jgi:hypothetical protein